MRFPKLLDHLIHKPPTAPAGERPVAEGLSALRDSGLTRREEQAIDRYIATHHGGWAAENGTRVIKGSESGLPRTLQVLDDGSVAVWLRTRLGEGADKVVKKAALVRFADDGTADVRPIAKLSMHPRDDHAVQRLRDEGKALHLSRNVPHVVHAIEIDELDRPGKPKKVVFFEERAMGGSLASYLNEHHPSTDARHQLMLDSLKGLAGLHALEILHRDIKLENLLVTPDASGLHATIADLGSHAFAGDPHADMAGTLSYLSPAVAAGMLAHARDPKAAHVVQTKADDIFAMGMVLYAIENDGEAPTFGSVHTNVAKHLLARAHLEARKMAKDGIGKNKPGTVGALIDSMLALDPAARPTAQQAFDGLSAILRRKARRNDAA